MRRIDDDGVIGRFKRRRAAFAVIFIPIENIAQHVFIDGFNFFADQLVIASARAISGAAEEISQPAFGITTVPMSPPSMITS